MSASPVSKLPSTRDPERVRSRILTAGTELFSAHGFAGTSFRDVAKAAGVSISLIQHHFGTKDSLYAAVKEHALAQYVQSQGQNLERAGTDFELFVEGGLRQFFRFFEASPEWSRLVAWTALEGDNRMWPGEDAFVDRVAAEVRKGQAKGLVAKDADPDLLLIAAAGLMKAWVHYRERHAHRLMHLGALEEQEQQYLALCMRLLLGANRPRTRGRR